MKSNARRSRGFTLAEMMLAGVIAAFVIGAVTASLSQLGRARSGARLRLEAYVRADAAISAIRRDIISVLRDPDLFWTRLLLTDGTTSTPLGRLDRDQILLFDAQLRPVRDLAFIGEGEEFETQYRIEEDPAGAVLWQRRDAIPDEYPAGGGVATPLADGVVAMGLEAYDGIDWREEWDSDFDGLPWAVRVTVTASGCKPGEDPFDAPLAVLRTVVPIDRVAPPAEPPKPADEAAPAEGAAPGEATPEGSAPTGPGTLPPGAEGGPGRGPPLMGPPRGGPRTPGGPQRPGGPPRGRPRPSTDSQQGGPA